MTVCIWQLHSLNTQLLVKNGCSIVLSLNKFVGYKTKKTSSLISLPSGVYAGIFASSCQDSHGTPVGITLGMPVKRFVPGSQREFDRDPRADKKRGNKIEWIPVSTVAPPIQSFTSTSLSASAKFFFRERSEIFTMLEFANCICIYSHVWKKSAFAKTLV